MNQAYIAQLIYHKFHIMCAKLQFFFNSDYSSPFTLFLPLSLSPPPSPIFASQGWQYASLLLKHIITLASEDAPSPSEGEKS